MISYNSTMQPIRVWMFPEGPNPLKVIYVLEELQIPYEIKRIQMQDVKKEPLTLLNPNGRVPVIEDPNNSDLVLWESGAILTYLVERYDTDNRITYREGNEKHLLSQWLYFQASGQGPYFGQLSWFQRLHPEKLPSVIERYQNEADRILGVLEGHLANRQWLVGDKMTYVDMAWVPYTYALGFMRGNPTDEAAERERQALKGFPKVLGWHRRLTSRESWTKTAQLREKLLQSA
ncbi:glutathione transferase [Xylariomycetidae sp. FL2044]|nr:glutathione transferase [Xylariomycetidae sp. FL2044]